LSTIDANIGNAATSTSAKLSLTDLVAYTSREGDRAPVSVRRSARVGILRRLGLTVADRIAAAMNRSSFRRWTPKDESRCLPIGGFCWAAATMCLQASSGSSDAASTSAARAPSRIADLKGQRLSSFGVHRRNYSRFMAAAIRCGHRRGPRRRSFPNRAERLTLTGAAVALGGDVYATRSVNDQLRARRRCRHSRYCVMGRQPSRASHRQQWNALIRNLRAYDSNRVASIRGIAVRHDHRQQQKLR